MTALAYRQERCKGCLLCVDACKKHALAPSSATNAQGYQTVAPDPARCVLCGSCYLVCPDCCFEIREDGP